MPGLTKKQQTKSNRIKTPYSGRKNSRNRSGRKTETRESLNPNKPVRFTKEKLQQRVNDIQALGVCQVCEASHDLDYPHHVEQGSKKDDRTMINICVECHDWIHRVGYSMVEKDRFECLEIAKSNHKLLEK